MIQPLSRFCLISSLLVATGSVSSAAPTSIVARKSMPAETAVLAPKSKAQHTKVSAAAKVSRPFRLIVPMMGLDIPVVSGTDNDALRLAPGHDPLSALPGEKGNCVIASHRNVHGAYFWYLTKVTPGALITLQTPRETFVYKVASARVVPESQTDLLDNDANSGTARLTLYTCTLPVSRNRLVVVANLMSGGATSPGAFNRPAMRAEITSGPLRLLKDKALHARYQALLRYAESDRAKAAPITNLAPPEKGPGRNVSKSDSVGQGIAIPPSRSLN